MNVSDKIEEIYRACENVVYSENLIKIISNDYMKQAKKGQRDSVVAILEYLVTQILREELGEEVGT